MLTTAKKATCHTFLCALAFVSVADAQVVEKGRTFDDLTASHPCASGLENRIARVTDCDAADDFGDGGGAFQCWAYCDGSAPWTNLAIGGGGGGGIDGTLTATDNLIVRTDGTGGSTIQASPLTLSDVSGVTTTLATITPAATTGATVAGQALAITASPAVASTDTAGAAAGGSVTITAGAAARNTSGNANGGNINLITGAGIGTGTAGQVIVPDGVSESVPALAFSGASNTGFRLSGGSLVISRAGTDIVSIGYSLTGSHGSSALNGFKLLTVASTDGVGSPNALIGMYSLSYWTNEGSTAANYHTLPTATTGWQYSFCVQDADGLRVTANTSDTIRVIDKVTAAAGYIESTTIGSCVTLVAINAVEWFATSINGVFTDGTWTFDNTSLTTP